MEDGVARLAEAEQLLVEAWTGEPLLHSGEFWDVKFPQLRPRPYQKPHPPLIRACISEASTIAMAQIGRPVMFGVQTLDTLRQRFERYETTMLDSGFSESETETALDQCWASRDLFVSESYDEALEIAGGGIRTRAYPLPARPRGLQPRRIPAT